MDKKILIPLAVALGAVGLIAGAYVLYPSRTPSGQEANLPKHAAVMGVYYSSSDTSVTITLQNSRQQTFKISPATKIVSQVASGEVGRTLSQFVAGEPVQVQPSDKDKYAADMVVRIPGPMAAGQDAAGPSVMVTGILVATSSEDIVIRTPQDPALKVAVNPGTTVYSNVLAGQAGVSLADVGPGTYVQVDGVSYIEGIAARSIQLMVPLVQ